MLKSFFPCTAPMLATLLTTALNLAAQYREFEAAATTAASVQPFTKHTGVSFGQTTNTLIPIPFAPCGASVPTGISLHIVIHAMQKAYCRHTFTTL